MATPEQIAADLLRGKAYFSELNAENIQDLKKGCNCGCDDKLSVCLARIVKGLQYRVDQNIYDDITNTLYTQMILIIGDYVPNPPEPIKYKADYGFSSINYFGNESNAVFQFNKFINLAATTINFNYTNASQGYYLYFRVPTGQPIFNNWSIDIDEYGIIPDLQWRAKVSVSGYDYYLSRNIIFLNTNNTTITYTYLPQP